MQNKGMHMETFYIITNTTKDERHKISDQIRDYLEMRGKTCLTEPEELESQRPDCAIAIGGDGTLLLSARELLGEGIPLLGVNMGTLGYLTEVEVQNLLPALDQLIEGKYAIEDRMMLSGNIKGMKEDIALNDIVVTRSESLHIVRLKLYVNGEYLTSYQADGLIISTPTGSTAYNLSAGGPIVEPTASMILITPICSHSLNKSSIVLSASDELEIEISSRRKKEREEAVVTFDGTDIMKLETGDRVRVRKAKEVTKLVKLSNISFLETLREKMKGN